MIFESEFALHSYLWPVAEFHDRSRCAINGIWRRRPFDMGCNPHFSAHRRVATHPVFRQSIRYLQVLDSRDNAGIDHVVLLIRMLHSCSRRGTLERLIT